MTTEVGIYRGSFDPPHKGHFEAVNYALQNGMSSVTIVYTDTNRFKPFRYHCAVREGLLKTMFAGMQNVVISPKSYKMNITDLTLDPTIAKVNQIVGSDILTTVVRPISLPSKLSYFVIPRVEHPIRSLLSTWNNLPVKVGDAQQLIEQHNSSSKVRESFFERNTQLAQLALPSTVFEQIMKEKLFVSTDNEYQIRTIFKEVKKTVESEIVTRKIILEDRYPLSFHLGSDMKVGGLSSDVICFVKDKEGQIVLAVKIFVGEGYERNYDSEVLGYKTIAELDLNLVKVPELFFCHQKEGFAFIGMSFARGRPLAEIMQNSDAIQLCARANLELHMATTVSSPKITVEQLTTYESSIQRITEKLREIDSSFLASDAIENLKTKWTEVRKAFLCNPGLCSFTHGDPNHYNWIVDLENNCVSYIDLSLFSRSVFREGIPSGFPMNELEEALLTFRIAGKTQGFSKNEIREIQARYNDEYMTYAPDNITTPEARLYFSSYWKLRVIEELIKKLSSSKSLEDRVKYQNQLSFDMNKLSKS